MTLHIGLGVLKYRGHHPEQIWEMEQDLHDVFCHCVLHQHRSILVILLVSLLLPILLILSFLVPLIID